MKNKKTLYTFSNIPLLALVVLSVLFSPLFTLFLVIFILILFSRYLNNYSRKILFLIGSFSWAIIYASRGLIDELKNDLTLYFDSYLYIVKGSPLGEFWNGSEVLWVYIYQFFSYFFTFSTPWGLYVFHIFLCLFLFLIWIEKYGFESIKNNEKSIVLGIILIFLNASNIGYLQRQALSIIFLLFALSNIDKSKSKFILFSFLSSIGHLTSLLLIFFYWVLIKIKTKKIKFLFTGLTLSLVCIRFFFTDIIELFLFIGVGEFNRKLSFYNLGNASSFGFSSINEAIIFFILTIGIVFYKKNISQQWVNILIFTLISYFVLLGLPLLSFRLNFILTYLYGFFIFLTYQNTPFKKKIILFCLFYTFLVIFQKANMINFVPDSYWSRYPIFSFEPFYYLQ